jgi:hypothetical protein
MSRRLLPVARAQKVGSCECTPALAVDQRVVLDGIGVGDGLPVVAIQVGRHGLGRQRPSGDYRLQMVIDEGLKTGRVFGLEVVNAHEEFLLYSDRRHDGIAIGSFEFVVPITYHPRPTFAKRWCAA